MLKYAAQRILLMLVTLFIITLMCFVLIRMLPVAILDTQGEKYTEIMAKREAFGYGKPYLVQFGIFLKSIFTKWDWGISDTLYYGQDVAAIFAEKLPATMVVNLFSIILSIPIGISLGIWAALKKNKITDHVISTITMLTISVPSFVYAFLVQYFLSYNPGNLPFQVEFEGGIFTPRALMSMIPPVLSLSFGVIAGFTRVTRAELTEVLTSEFMLLARTKGLTRTQATVRHAMKNCMVVILPAIFGEFIGIMSGSLIIEKIFTIPGVGGLYLNSISGATNPDYPIFMLVTVFYTFISLFSGIIVDISYGFIDPRIRMGSRK
ncbi:MAG: ABC transporter permease [Clostridia bacterium]|nr:ABC transporter permease [Clostridia bacterium]